MSRLTELSVAFQGNKRAAEYGELAEAVERYGFDILSVYADLMFQPAIHPLLIMAQHTRRIRLGPAALNPYTLHPVEIAGQIAALDDVSNGRAYLGLVRGAWLDSLGIAVDKPVARLAEAIAVIRRLLAGDRGGFDGQFFQLAPGQGVNYPVLRPDVPLVIGTWGPKLARLAAEVADEVKLGGTANSNLIPVMRDYLATGETASGRPVGSTRIAIGAVTVVDEDGDQARALARREIALYFPVVASLDPTLSVPPELIRRVGALADQGKPDEAGALIPDDLLRRFAFAGTPADIIDQATACFAAGASRVEFGTPHGLSEAAGLRLLGEKVLPVLRS